MAKLPSATIPARSNASQPEESSRRLSVCASITPVLSIVLRLAHPICLFHNPDSTESEMKFGVLAVHRSDATNWPADSSSDL